MELLTEGGGSKRGPARLRILAVGIAVAVAAAAILGCGGDAEPKRFDRQGFPATFLYPGDLELTEELELAREQGSAADESLALARDEHNALIVERYTLEIEIEIDEDNLGLARRELDDLVQAIDPGAEGEAGETAGFPSIAYEPVELPEQGTSRYLALFDGDRELRLNCQSTSEGREEIAAACDQAIETMEPQ